MKYMSGKQRLSVGNVTFVFPNARAQADSLSRSFEVCDVLIRPSKLNSTGWEALHRAKAMGEGGRSKFRFRFPHFFMPFVKKFFFVSPAFFAFPTAFLETKKKLGRQKEKKKKKSYPWIYIGTRYPTIIFRTDRDLC